MAENTASESQRGAHIQVMSPCGPTTAPRSPSASSAYSRSTRGGKAVAVSIVSALDMAGGSFFSSSCSSCGRQRGRGRSDAGGAGVVLLVFAPPALAHADVGDRCGEFDGGDPLDHLEAELGLDP